MKEKNNVNAKYFLLLVLVILTQILTACGLPATRTPEPITVVQGFYDALNDRDINRVMFYFADDALQIDAFGNRFEGAEAIRTTLQSAINDTVTVTVRDATDTNGRVVYKYDVYVGGGYALTVDGLTVITDGKIIFDGTQENWAEECEKNPAQTFCTK